MRRLPPGLAPSAVLLRVLVLVLPCGALLLALPETPHWAVVAGVLATSAFWARNPDHALGVASLALVGGWWASRGVVDWRVLVVAVLLLLTHVAATVAAHGPAAMAVGRRLVRLWLGRALLALVPVPVAWLAVRGLDPALAPSWLWLATGALTVALLVGTARLTRSDPA